MDAERRPARAVRAQARVRLVRGHEAALDHPARQLEQLALEALGVGGRVDRHGGLSGRSRKQWATTRSAPARSAASA